MPNIPDHLKVAKKSANSGNIIVLGRLMYASFYTSVRPSKSETNPKKFQYGTTLLIPAGSDLKVLNDEINAIFEGNVVEAKRKTTKWKNPILDSADTGSTAAYAEDYPFLIRPNAKQFQRNGQERARPDVVDSQGVPVPADREPQETYNGRWARLSLQPYWYPGEDGKPGVALGLVNVQLLYHDDPLAGGKAKASSDFEAVEGLEDVGEFA